MDLDVDINKLDEVVKKKGLGCLLKWVVPIAIVLVIAYTLWSNKDAGLDQIKSWVLWNGSLSALGTLLAFGHPLSILTAFVMAPITSLNPLLAAGWFAGMVEALVRKPKVKDLENLSMDTTTLKGFWKNEITRILLVVVFANVFSSVGTFISGLDIFSTFFKLVVDKI